MLFRSSVRESFSWYFPVMQPRSLPVEPAVVTPRRRPSTPLSVIYADALYRPVPPVEYDDEGYPGPDGRVSESTRHAEASNYCFDALRVWFRDQPGTLVANDLVMLFEKGNPKAALSPDLMVVFNAGNPDRSSYKVWEEGDAVPAFALEVLSKRTWHKDVRVKPGLYAALGVREFWLFEPFEPRLAGYRLDGREYTRIRPAAGGGLPSRVLGLEVIVEDDRIRFRNAATGEILPDHVHADAMRVEAEARAESAVARAESAEARAESAEERARRAERRIEELLKR
ncbi:MAG: Uma2 family endonuclease [Gammaproteobacteria bacterium]|nr:Uma2 family endonuclease [Gammaproteobacteria bacterium]MYK47345.1 Uma2 family endonuclease [Gammaproteobacteria bacterium]